MTLGKIKRRLKDQANYFRHQPEYVKAKFRELYRIARDAVHYAEMRDMEVDELRSPRLGEVPAPSYPGTHTAPLGELDRYSRVNMMKAFIRAGDFSSPTYLRFLRFTGLTHEEAIKLVEPDFPR